MALYKVTLTLEVEADSPEAAVEHARKWWTHLQRRVEQLARLRTMDETPPEIMVRNVGALIVKAALGLFGVRPHLNS